LISKDSSIGSEANIFSSEVWFWLFSATIFTAFVLTLKKNRMSIKVFPNILFSLIGLLLGQRAEMMYILSRKLSINFRVSMHDFINLV